MRKQFISTKTQSMLIGEYFLVNFVLSSSLDLSIKTSGLYNSITGDHNEVYITFLYVFICLSLTLFVLQKYTSESINIVQNTVGLQTHFLIMTTRDI